MGIAARIKGLLSGRRDSLPRRLIVRDCGYILDGGTIDLLCIDEAGREINVRLAQRAVPLDTPSKIAGRLYFASQLVPIRSDLEARVLRLLSEADVRVPPSESGPVQRVAVLGDDIRQFLSRTPEENCRAFLREIVEFVQSERYVSFAAEVERAAGGK